MLASLQNTIDVVNKLITLGASVQTARNDGRTALLYATGNKDPNVIATLLKAGADIKAQDNNGLTALMAAARDNQNPEVMATLLKAGADIEARDKDGFTALIYAAAKNQNPEVITTLLKAGADAKAAYGITLLMVAAARNQNPDVIDTLLKAGVDINPGDEDGETALMYAAEKNQNPEVIITLLKAGADAKAKDNAGKTAFDYAQGNEKLKGTDAYSKLASANVQTAENAAHEGVNGWGWVAATDPMTDIPYVNFFKQPTEQGSFLSDTALTVEYIKNVWLWGITRSLGWKSDKQVTYRLGKDAAKTETFKSDGGKWLIYKGLMDVKKFLKYPQVLIRVEGDDTTLLGISQPATILQFDMTGLAETIQMAGLSIK